jgi:hypothetical protein
LQKSSIFFGEGCVPDTKEMAKQVLEVDTEALSERYLGLPTVVGRSKEGCFQYITERSGLKVSGWKGQGLSKKGKEILVKSVLQATPAYPMSCFKFNKTQCKKLGSISANFWWGDADGSPKVHWIAWDKMCQPKRSGGWVLGILKLSTWRCSRSRHGGFLLSLSRCVHESSRPDTSNTLIFSMQAALGGARSLGVAFCMDGTCLRGA